jgi:amidase
LPVGRITEYEKYDATGLAELVRKREVTPAELMEEAITRAEALNPRLNALVQPLFEHGRELAATEIPTGPFAGVPFLLKDLLQSYAGFPLTCGSGALRSYVPDESSIIVSRFRAAGLLPFGKTNVPELGLVATTEPAAYGATRNPWDTARSAGGSSGGSAAAVAARIVPMASANDGGGSIRIPASWCGLFGLKPSRGRVPVGPQYSEVWDGAVADHVLCRTVRDSAAALDATLGPAPGDPYIFAVPERPYVEEVRRDPGKLKIAFTTRSPLGTPVDPECSLAVSRAAELLAGLGHELVEEEDPVDGQAVVEAYLILYYGHVAADLRWIARGIGEKAARANVEPTTLLVAMIGESLSSAEYVESRRRWNLFGRAMGEFHERYDLYMTPSTASPAIQLGSLAPTLPERLATKLVTALRVGGMVRSTGVTKKIAMANLAPVPFTQLANLTGQPAMSVPLHVSDNGLPCGVHFMAAMGNEALLYRVAAQLEQANPWAERRPPLAP